MKSYLFKLSLNLLLILVAGFSFAQTSPVKFEKKALSFGKVQEGEAVRLTYYFRNLGKHVLSIVPPQVDCSCTEVVIPETNIAGGARDSVVVLFNTNDKIGYQQREVMLQFTSDFMDSQSINEKIIFKGVVKATDATKERYKDGKKNP
ncbi:MAG: DUF1573 domain-containing protein [Flavobacteriales bacterium]|nr:DUF1573 domain-containing protein [Flavobacteriales bacterium]